MGFDGTAAEALVSNVARTFVEGLEGLVAVAAAELAEENRRIILETSDLSVRRARLAEERVQLERERANFERERSLFGPQGKEQPDMVSLNLGGEAHITVLRSTLTQCEDSMLAAAFSGRWDLPKDESGNIFVDFEPAIFLPLVQHLRMRRIEGPEDPTAPPAFDTCDLEARFQRMLRYYGLEDWVYRENLPEALQYQAADAVHIHDHIYAVLPPESPDETVAFGDMSCQTVAIPRGWEVLQTDVGRFDEIIRDLANHGWGALRLCCQNPGGSFSSYLTCLHGGGTAGTCWSGDARLLQAVGAAEGRLFRFSSACSARLVIRAQARGDRSLHSSRANGEGRRLAAI